jgi:hypothetical protein
MDKSEKGQKSTFWNEPAGLIQLLILLKNTTRMFENVLEQNRLTNCVSPADTEAVDLEFGRDR